MGGRCWETEVESFTGKKACLLCRLQEYETRVINKGKTFHRVNGDVWCVRSTVCVWEGDLHRFMLPINNKYTNYNLSTFSLWGVPSTRGPWSSDISNDFEIM